VDSAGVRERWVVKYLSGGGGVSGEGGEGGEGAEENGKW